MRHVLPVLRWNPSMVSSASRMRSLLSGVEGPGDQPAAPVSLPLETDPTQEPPVEAPSDSPADAPDEPQ